VNNDHLVFNYNHHRTEGLNVTLSCVHNSSSCIMFKLVGSRIVMCTSTRQWEPDPREVECKGTDFDINANPKHVCHNNHGLSPTSIQ
jgi:hypothetical protein